MIHEYLKREAAYLDEAAFKVDLQGRADTANAEFYDGDYYSPSVFQDFFERIFRAKLHAARIEPGPSDHVLDACCGQGHLGMLIARSFGSSVAFCDLSRTQLSSLRNRLSSEPNAARLTVHETDICKLPFADGTFDFVLGNSFLHHLPDVSAGLAELRRVLKRGGRGAFLVEPGVRTPFWQSFPLSLVKDTSPVAGFTDLWQFTPSDLRRLALGAGYAEARVLSSGILSAIATNWYAIPLQKLGMNAPMALKPLFLARVALETVGLRVPSRLLEKNAPNLMLVVKG